MPATMTSIVDQVTEVLRRLLTPENQDYGLRDFVTSLARELKVTFEKARDALYAAIDAQQIELTPAFTVRLAA